MTIGDGARRFRGIWDSTRLFQLLGVARQAVTVLIAIALAKSGLDLADIGIYEQMFFLGYLLSFFWMDGLVRGFMALAGGMEPSGRDAFIATVAAVLLGIGAAMAALSILLASPLIGLFAGGGIPTGHWYVFALFLFAYQASMLVEHVLLIRRDDATQWRWMIFSSLGLLATLLVPIWLGGQLIHGLYGLLGFGGMRLLAMWRLCRPVWSWEGQAMRIREWWRLSLPLIAYAVAAGGALVLDGWIINAWFRDPEVFAVYRYGARELPFTAVLAGATGTVFIGRLAEAWAEALPELRTRTLRLMHVFFPLTAVLMFFSEPLFTLVFRDELAPAAGIFRIYLFLLVSRFILSGSLFTARGETGFLLKVGLAELGLNVLLSLVGVAWFGLAGVAWATVIAFSFEKVVHVWVLWRRRGIPPDAYLPWRWWLGYTTMLVAAYLLA